MGVNKYGLDLGVGPLWHTPFWQTKVFIFVMLVLFLAAFILAYKYVVREQNYPAEDPAISVIKELETLKEKVNSINVQEFYFNLVANSKNFVKYRYNINVVVNTDVEIKRALKASSLCVQVKDVFVRVIESSHTARFAKEQVSRSKMEQDLQNTLTVFRQALESSSKNN